MCNRLSISIVESCYAFMIENTKHKNKKTITLSCTVLAVSQSSEFCKIKCLFLINNNLIAINSDWRVAAKMLVDLAKKWNKTYLFYFTIYKIKTILFFFNQLYLVYDNYFRNSFRKIFEPKI